MRGRNITKGVPNIVRRDRGRAFKLDTRICSYCGKLPLPPYFNVYLFLPSLVFKFLKLILQFQSNPSNLFLWCLAWGNLASYTSQELSQPTNQELFQPMNPPPMRFLQYISSSTRLAWIHVGFLTFEAMVKLNRKKPKNSNMQIANPILIYKFQTSN
jgi:hypothetical protein